MILLAAGYAGRELSLQENLLLYVPAIAIAAVTFSVIEDPVLSAKSLRKRPAFASVGLGVSLVAISFGTVSAIMEANHLDGEQTDVEITIEVPSTAGVLRAVSAGVDVNDWPEQPQRIVNEAYSDTCDGTRQGTTSALCEFGNLDSGRTVVMFGDSHGTMWIPALNPIGKEHDWR